MAENTHLTGKIIGFHVSGLEGVGDAILITREMLLRELVVKEVNDTGPCEFEERMVVQSTSELTVCPDGRFYVVGRIPPKDVLFQPNKTEIRKSEIHGEVYEPTTGPACLSKFDPLCKAMNYDPLERGVEKNGVTGRDFDLKRLETVLEFTKIEQSSIDPKYPREILSEKEAINGIEGERYAERINLDSSPGFPFVKVKKSNQPGKSAFINGEVGNLQVVHPMLRERLDERLKMAKLGKRIPSTWCDTLKDERRPLEKRHKARVFNIGPLDHTILCKRYFGRYIAWYMRNREHHSGAVGMNVDSVEWDRMIKKLLSFSDVGFDGDYSKYDSKMRAQLIIDYFVELVNDWYNDGEENARIRRVLMEEVAFTVHRVGNCMYVSFQGNKSGCVVTTILNCVVNDFYGKYAYLEIMHERAERLIRGVDEEEYEGETKFVLAAAKLSAFVKYICMKVYGDDNVVAVSRQVLKYFNARTFGEIMARYEIEYTPATKGERMSDYDPILSLQFLKRSIRYDEEACIYMAPIDPLVIQELTNWVRKCPDEREALYVNVENGARFAFQAGRVAFATYKREVNNGLRKHNLRLLNETYDDYAREYVLGF